MRKRTPKSKKEKIRRPSKPDTRSRSKGKGKGKPRAAQVASRKTGRPRAARTSANEASTVELLEERIAHSDSTPLLSGGDLDADWQRAGSSGEEAVGGSVATPDQDVVDEIGRALGVEQASTAPVVTSGEILQDRDRRRWDLERRAPRGKR
jgi:hypothetical protein